MFFRKSSIFPKIFNFLKISTFPKSIQTHTKKYCFKFVIINFLQKNVYFFFQKTFSLQLDFCSFSNDFT
jgi:hypothetical protein